MLEKGAPDFLWLDGQIIPWDEAPVHITVLEWGAVPRSTRALEPIAIPVTDPSTLSLSTTI